MTRPHGLRMRSHVMSSGEDHDELQPTMRTHQSYSLYVNGPKP